LEKLIVAKERIYQIIALVGLALIVVGAALYIADSAYRTLMYGALIGGAAVVLIFAVFNIGLIIAFFQKRSSRHGVNMIVMIVVFTSILVIIQALSVRHSLRYDLTRNKRFSLADQTRNVLDSLQQDVGAYAFFQKGSPERVRADDLLKEFTHRSTRFTYQLIDPDQRPQSAKEMGIVTYGTTVVQARDRTEHVKTLNEENLLNAIAIVTGDAAKVIYFVKGHGEKDPTSDKPGGYSIAAQAAEGENFEVRTLSLFDEAMVPDDCWLLIIAGPRRDYFESEIAKISDYLGQGRNALLLLDPQTDIPNIEGLLKSYRIVINNDAIVDPFSRVFGGDYSVPVVSASETHEITRDFGLATFYPTARSVGIADTDMVAVNIQYLAKTGKSAWGETNLDLIDKGQAVKDAGDNPAPVPIAVIAEKRLKNGEPSQIGFDLSEVVVFGDSDFADNSSFRLSGNADLFLNVVSYLAEEKDRIAIRAKQGLGDRLFLTASQGRFIFLVSVIILPLLVIVFGTTVFVRRQRRG
jgi:ABC-type uncharacterized transport system involved in gliding motility auxiliary subunit